MIGIIGAMKPEIDGIKAIIENKKTQTISGVEYVSGTVDGTEVVAAQCGIGKVFAAICAQTMILEYSPEKIINVGVGGTLSNELSIGDIAVATEVVQHDMDTSPLGDPVGLLSGINIVKIPCDKELSEKFTKCAQELNIKVIKGVIASGDQFIAAEEQKEKIKKNFSAIACEMEGGSIGQVCYVNKVPFCVVRAISDSADGEAEMDYPNFMKMAADNSAEVIKRFLKR
ncbi:MAG: 5'-methylthioadenosine/adenosylhomocysteine nucleosidase [Clostridia bacterium]|nr:5'-methylthioadenosine/adenosylhomocysteine nucleosidase [Clostridia bacterium]